MVMGGARNFNFQRRRFRTKCSVYAAWALRVRIEIEANPTKICFTTTMGNAKAVSQRLDFERKSSKRPRLTCTDLRRSERKGMESQECFTICNSTNNSWGIKYNNDISEGVSVAATMLNDSNDVK